MTRALRLVVYDATQRSRAPRTLGLSWQYGTQLYRALGRVDAAYGARSFADAFDWLKRTAATQPIAELQFWGHGKWGQQDLERSCHIMKIKLRWTKIKKINGGCRYCRWMLS